MTASGSLLSALAECVLHQPGRDRGCLGRSAGVGPGEPSRSADPGARRRRRAIPRPAAQGHGDPIRPHRYRASATSGTIRLGLRCPERSDALEYATSRTLDAAQVPAYGIGLFQRLDHLFDALDSELKAAQDGLAREETNLTSYTDQLARPFEHEEARSLLSATLRASTASSPTIVARAVHLPRLVSTRLSTTRLLPEEQSRLRRVRQLSVTGVRRWPHPCPFSPYRRAFLRLNSARARRWGRR